MGGVAAFGHRPPYPVQVGQDIERDLPCCIVRDTLNGGEGPECFACPRGGFAANGQVDVAEVLRVGQQQPVLSGVGVETAVGGGGGGERDMRAGCGASARHGWEGQRFRRGGQRSGRELPGTVRRLVHGRRGKGVIGVVEPADDAGGAGVRRQSGRAADRAGPRVRGCWPRPGVTPGHGARGRGRRPAVLHDRRRVRAEGCAVPAGAAPLARPWPQRGKGGMWWCATTPRRSTTGRSLPRCCKARMCWCATTPSACSCLAWITCAVWPPAPARPLLSSWPEPEARWRSTDMQSGCQLPWRTAEISLVGSRARASIESG